VKGDFINRKLKVHVKKLKSEDLGLVAVDG
jgi:hypothetical protein